MSKTQSTIAPWANATRSSYVAVPMGAPAGFRRVSEIPRATEGWRNDFVMVAEHHVVVMRRAGFSLFDQRTSTWASVDVPAENGQLTPTGVMVGVSEFRFDAKPTGRYVADIHGDIPGRTWVMGVEADTVCRVVQQIPLRSPPPQLAILVHRFAPGSPQATFWAGTALEDTHGMGAAFDDGCVAVATTTAGYVLFGRPEPEPMSTPPRLAERTLSFTPYEISVDERGVGLLEAVDTEVLPSGEGSPYSRWMDLALRWSQVKRSWSTRFHVLERAGEEVYASTVPFPVLQPPISGGSGRHYLAGLGFAAIQDGQIAYFEQSEVPCLAASFRDGDVVRARGPELRLISRDGRVLRSFRVAEGETITTPPAIGRDGSTWVATDAALYVMR